MHPHPHPNPPDPTPVATTATRTKEAVTMPYQPHVERPRALTPEVQRDILRFMSMGAFLSPACRAAGISVDTFYHWRKRCEGGDREAQVYADFFGAFACACARAEIDAVAA